MDISRKILSDIIVYMKYAKYDKSKNRRETWDEIIDRCRSMHIKKFPKFKKEIDEAFKLVYDKKILPSMRSLHYGGRAIERNNARLYNCSALVISSVEAFREHAFLLLSGCGVGYSVQRHHIKQLPKVIKNNTKKRRYKFMVPDSIEGWAQAIDELVKYYFGVRKSYPVFDYSDVRKKGMLLKTSGGRSPGPQPLKDCIHNVEKVFQDNLNKKLGSVAVNDICCYIADMVVVGGSRRCIAKGSKVITKSSVIPIEDIQEKDLVSTSVGWKPVTKVYKQGKQEVIKLTYQGGSLLCTREHKVAIHSFTQRRALYKDNHTHLFANVYWKRAGDLTLNDKLVYKDFTAVDLISIEKVKDEVETYDIEVKDEHAFVCEDILVHNSSSICLFSFDDNDLAEAKYADWYIDNPQRGRANNSAVMLRQKITEEDFKDYFEKMKISGTGDPAFMFSNNPEMITNPCGEIGLRIHTPTGTGQMCNLVEINAHNIEDQEDLNYRAKMAARIATFQSSYTNFHFLRESWKEITDMDALIGVGITGIASNKLEKLNLKEAARVVLEENESFASLIGTNKSARCTTVKPSGTTSLVLGTSSGIHSWYSDYYIRRISVYKDEPIYKYLKEKIPNILEDNILMPSTEAYICMPMKAPENSITQETALQLLNRVKKFYKEWILPGHRSGDNTNNISCTVEVKDGEWDRVGNWLWENKDNYAAISLFPHLKSTHPQLIFEAITKEQYEEKIEKIKKIDLKQIKEKEDNTTLQQEAACVGGACEIV